VTTPRAPRVIGVDVGGTKILAGVIGPDGAIVERYETPTPLGSQDELVEALVAAAEALVSDGVAAVGYGLPSRIDRRTGTALASANIPLQDVPFRDLASRRLTLPVAIDNDANAAALAEWRVGAGRGTLDMLMLTLGTGVGGGVVVDGRPFRGWAELGHIVLQAFGEPCQGTCTGHGHFEAVASGSAADRLAQRLWGGGADAELLVERAKAGDDEAVEALTGLGRLVGAGIGSLVNIFNPEVVVLGGGFGTAAGELVRSPALEVARLEALAPAGQRLRIVEAELGEDAGVVGAGMLAFELLDVPL
jgi:glucokinase